MDDDSLRSELAQVTSELAAATTEYASLGAKIAGLEARRAALARAVPDTEAPHEENVDIIGKVRTDDIVEVLTAAGSEMSINDVVTALRAAGRPNETYENVSVDLAYLVSNKRAQRVRRGVYSAIQIEEPTAHADARREIPITRANIVHSHMYLSKNLDFFPADSIGGPSREAGQGRSLTLHFEGLSEPVETDIASDKKFFRDRSALRQFFKHHDLREGDKVTIERQSEYVYRIRPIRQRTARA